mgnify:CR=1 FL=1
MRLSDEKSLLEQMTIEQARQNIALLKAEEIEMPKKWVLELLNTIEALQQENKQLRAKLDEWKYEAKCHMDEVIAREKQIEQLQAQAARMREALRKAREAIKAAWSDGSVNAAMDKASEALTAIDKAIGGKEE